MIAQKNSNRIVFYAWKKNLTEVKTTNNSITIEMERICLLLCSFVVKANISQHVCDFQQLLIVHLLRTEGTIQQIHMQTFTEWSLKIYIDFIELVRSLHTALNWIWEFYIMLWTAIACFWCESVCFLKTSNSIAGDYEYL